MGMQVSSRVLGRSERQDWPTPWYKALNLYKKMSCLDLVTGPWLSCEAIWWHPQVACIWSLSKAACGLQRALSKHAPLGVASAVWVPQPSGWLNYGHGDLTLPH